MILLTGATGLVGSHILLNLLRQDKNVRALIRGREKIRTIERVFGHYEADPEALLSRVEWIEADLMDSEALMSSLEGVTEVIHAAAIVSFDRRDKEELFRINHKGTASLVNICLQAGVRKLAYVSSVAALGSATADIALDENAHWDDPPQATNYSRSKYLAEMEVWRGVEEGLSAVIVNPATIIGPGDWGRGSTALIYRVYNGMKVYTDGVTGYVDVRDVARATLELLFSGVKNERFVLCSGNMSYRELFTKAARALGRPAPRIRVRSWLMLTAWAIDNMKSLLLNKRSMITLETARKAFSHVEYDGSKICRSIGFNYIPLDESIGHAAQCLLHDVRITNYDLRSGSGGVK